MTATEMEVKSEEPQENLYDRPLARMVDFGLTNYGSVKDLVAQNKKLNQHISPLVNYSEETVVALLKKSPVQVEEIVKAVDSRVEKVAVSVGERYESVRKTTSDTVQSVREAPTRTLEYVHDKLSGLRIEETPEEEKKEEEVDVHTVLVDAKEVTAEHLNVLLDASEGYLQQYLPPTEEEKEDILSVGGKKTEIRPVANRVFNLSKVAATRMQTLALSKMGPIQMRAAENIAHVDLVKYSEWLDNQKEMAKDTIYISLEKLDEKLMKPAKDTLVTSVTQVQDMTEKSSVMIKEKVILPAKTKLESIEIPFQDHIVHVWTLVSDQYTSRVVEPRDQIIQMFREELALQQELAKQKTGGEEMTIQAGLEAVIAAARARLAKEWEVRVSPSLARFMGKSQDQDNVSEYSAEETSDSSE